MDEALFMAIYERTREFGLVQSLGMKPRLIVWQVLMESVVLLLIGALSGNLLGLLTVKAFSGGIDIAQFSKGTEMIGLSSMVYPSIRVSDWVLANQLILALGLFGSLYPAWRASKLGPMEAITRA